MATLCTHSVMRLPSRSQANVALPLCLTPTEGRPASAGIGALRGPQSRAIGGLGLGQCGHVGGARIPLVAQAKLSTAQTARRGLEARLHERAPTAPADGRARARRPARARASGLPRQPAGHLATGSTGRPDLARPGDGRSRAAVAGRARRAGRALAVVARGRLVARAPPDNGAACGGPAT